MNIAFLKENKVFYRWQFTSITKVKFAELEKEMIEAYVDSGEPFGKAGGYGIQGKAGSFIEWIDGCYFNVVGLPVTLFCQNLVSMMKEHPEYFNI